MISAATLKGWIADGGELAILDAREEGEFGAAHLFWAVPCPLSRAELRIPVLLPNRSTRVVCVDGGGDHAAKLAALLAGSGTPTCMCWTAEPPPGRPPATSSSPASTCPPRRSANGPSTTTTPKASTRRNSRR